MVRSELTSLAILIAVLGHSASGSGPAATGGVELLDFSSPTCGPCQQMAPTIDSLIHSGYPIRRIDVTRETQVAAQYNVPRVPTLIMLVDGQVFDRTTGAHSSQEIEGMFHRANAEVERRNQDRVRLQSPDRMTSVPPATQTAPPSSAWPSPAQQPRPFAAGGDSRGGEPRDLAVRPTALETRQSTFDSRATAGNSQPSTDPRLTSLLNASVRLRVDDAKGHSYGTGTIIDARQGEALVITCGHLFRDTKGQGPVTVEMFEAAGGGVRSVGQVAGQVISYDLDRDVALVAIRPGHPVAVAPVAPPRTTIDRGDRVVNIGCSNGQDPTLLSSRVTTLDRYQGPPNIETSGAPVEGRSGGGLFNQDGQLIGICFAADHEGNEGLYAALKAIHDELGVRGLSDIYTQRAPGAANATDALADGRPSAAGPIVRGQDSSDSMMAAPKRELASAVEPAANMVSINSPSAAPANLNPVEQAAWDEIMRRAATSEVICIIRPKQPGGQSEVITLDDVSPAFIRALASRNQPPATLTR